MPICIAFEGLDGTGKSSLVEAVQAKIKRDLGTFCPWTFATREPGSIWTGHGETLRKFVLEMPDLRPIERELIFYVDCNLHKRFIEDQQDAIILSDRGKWSHEVYLKAYHSMDRMSGEQYNVCKDLIELVCYRPDAVIYVEASDDIRELRMSQKNKDVIEQNGPDFFKYVKEGYEAKIQEAEFKGSRLLKISTDIDTIDSSADKVVAWLKDVFRAEELKSGTTIIFN